MKSEEISGEGEAEKEENLAEKLGRSVLVWKREGPSSPVLSWELWEPQSQFLHAHGNSNIFNQPQVQTDSRCFRVADLVSSRKLAAAYWELYQYHHFPHLHTNMHRDHLTDGDARLRRHHHQQLLKEKDVDKYLGGPFPAPNQPDSSSSLRRHVVSSIMQHHRSAERNNHALQPVSPTSIGSSMEIAPYDPAMTSTSSIDFKGRIGEPNYSFKTSTQLLKVLNRIWSLEEQHSSNVQLIKALKMELNHARMKIKDLVRDRQTDRHEIDDLMKQIAEDKLRRKNKEQDRVHAAVQSVKDELEDEKRLRKRSESLHRKLGREVSVVKASLSSALEELEREKSEKKLLENLCDEFAKGIKEYEQEVHILRQRFGWADRADSDRLILHISESWLDERMQMQLEEAETGFVDKKSIVDKLSLEIDTFLQAKQRGRSSGNLVARNCRNSLESVPLNDAVSAPQDAGDEDDSLGNDSNCFELQKTGNRGSTLQDAKTGADEIHETLKPDHIKNRPLNRQRNKNCIPSSLQVKLEEQMASVMSKNEDRKSHVVDMEEGKSTNRKPVGMSISEKSEREATEDGGHERRNKLSELHGVQKSHLIDDLIRSQMMVSESMNTGPDTGYGEASCSDSGWKNQASPVRQWMTEISSQDLVVSETCKPTSGANTLKAKLLEARTKGQRSRLKTQKDSL